MKSKLLVILSVLALALTLIAQNATQPTPPTTGDQAKTCACCNHDKADGKMTCGGKDGHCCKDGKCDMAGKDGDKAMMSEHHEMMSGDGKTGMKCPMMSKDSKDKACCCASGKCDMAKDGKSCCGGNKCERSKPAGA